jgi:hypothetical protein
VILEQAWISVSLYDGDHDERLTEDVHAWLAFALQLKSVFNLSNLPRLTTTTLGHEPLRV